MADASCIEAERDHRVIEGLPPFVGGLRPSGSEMEDYGPVVIFRSEEAPY